MKDECIIENNNRYIVFSENRSKLTIENIDRVTGRKVIVDGCEITEGLRCDFMYIIKNSELFIELKGQDLNHAIKQLETTINSLSNDEKNSKKISFIICTRSPLNSASIQNLQVKFRKNYNSKLIIKSSPSKYKI